MELKFKLILAGLSLGIIFGLPSIARFQTLPQARLIDGEFTPLSCEDAMARADHFANTLISEPGSQGYLIMYGDGNDGKRADTYAELIHRTLIGRGAIDSGVVVMRSRKRKSLVGEFWLVPKGTAFSRPNTIVLARIPMEIKGRTLYGVGTADPCSNHIDQGFARVLKSNSAYTGEIIEFNVPRKKQPETAALWVKVFREDYYIGRNQLRIRFKKVNRRKPTIGFGTEFWLLPSKDQ